MGEMASEDGSPVLIEEWNYTIGIKLFQDNKPHPTILPLPMVNEVDDVSTVPGYVFAAARQLLGLSQQQLHGHSGVSKKSINDFENGLIRLSDVLVLELATVFSRRGAKFVHGQGVIGVITTMDRSAVMEATRSSRRREALRGDASSD